MSKKFKYTTYIARPIEHFDKKETKDVGQIISEELSSPDLLIYDPVYQEQSKVGKVSEDQVTYIRNLKRAGKWDLVYNEMWKIWFGEISPNTDLLQLLPALRLRKHIDGNTIDDIRYWGDAEAVARSDFIIVYLPLSAKTVGVIYEVVFAFLLRIPIYQIIPDGVKTDANTSLLFGNQISNNGNLEVYYNVKDCCKAIKERYKL